MFKKLKSALPNQLPLLVFALTMASSVMAQETPTNNKHAFIPEQTARRDAMATIMPDYPQELVDEGIAGVVKTKIEMDSSGNVIRASVQPSLNPTLEKVVFHAIKKWKFISRPIPAEAPERTIISRLTFNFIIEDGTGRVEMFTPPQDAPPFEQLGGYDPDSEMSEWQKWSLKRTLFKQS